MIKVFIDTNILVYALDRHDPAKQKRCRECLRRCEMDRRGVISTQVLQEFFVTCTRKLGTDPLVTKSILHSLERFEIVTVTVDLVKDAIDCSILDRIAFWDALIVVAAESAMCAELWTEDLNAGQIIRNVRVVNPLPDVCERSGPAI